MIQNEYQKLYDLLNNKDFKSFQFKDVSNVEEVIEEDEKNTQSTEKCVERENEQDQSNMDDEKDIVTPKSDNTQTDERLCDGRVGEDENENNENNESSDEDDESSDENNESSDEDDDGEQETDKEQFYDTIEFDTLFDCHAKWMEYFASVQPSYQQYVQFTQDIQRLQKELDEHVRSGPQKADKVWDMFDEIMQGNNADIFEKKKNQYIEDIQYKQKQLDTFLEDIQECVKHLDEWEQHIVDKWEQVMHLFPVYGVPLCKNTCKTLQWLDEKGLFKSHYLGYVDTGYFLCSALLPYKNTILCSTLLTQLLICSEVDVQSLLRFGCSLHMLSHMYPYLRSWRTSSYAIRTDTLIGMLGMWVCDVDVFTILGIGSAVQLYMYLFSNDMKKHYPFQTEEDMLENNEKKEQ